MDNNPKLQTLMALLQMRLEMYDQKKSWVNWSGLREKLTKS
jgi:hypothetical protein